jgi:phosphoenolpyruvate synthase/pyruvate phosphate dikinase
MRSIIWLAECSEDCVDIVGGKATGLGHLLRKGFQVPPGFAVTTTAYREHVEHNRLEPEIARLLEAHGEGAADEIRNLFERSAPSPQIETEIIDAYQQLGGASKPVAVRSSANAEDQADASFAGQQETYLWLLGAETVVQHVVRCWASLFTSQAIAYRAHRGTPVDNLAMGVVVQCMVPAEAAGVMLTIDPITGDRSAITIEASYGLGAAVVNGEVTPDRFCVDKVTLDIRSRALGGKEVAYRFDPAVEGTRVMPVPPSQRRQACMTDSEVIELAKLGKRMEQAMGGRAQDMEWAIGTSREIYLLQARPETVWSQMQSTSQAEPGSTVMDRMLNMMTPPRPPG